MCVVNVRDNLLAEAMITNYLRTKMSLIYRRHSKTYIPKLIILGLDIVQSEFFILFPGSVINLDGLEA